MSVITAEATAELYAEAHDRIVHLARDINDDEAGRTVPGTPEWTVHDLLAHLSAIPSDIVSGRLTGVPSPGEATRQGEGRRGKRVGEILDEGASVIEAGIGGAGARPGPPPPPSDG